MTAEDPWLDPRFRSYDPQELDQARTAQDAARWLGAEYVTDVLAEADRSGVPNARAAAIDGLRQELLVRGPVDRDGESNDNIFLLLLS